MLDARRYRDWPRICNGHQFSWDRDAKVIWIEYTKEHCLFCMKFKRWTGLCHCWWVFWLWVWEKRDSKVTKPGGLCLPLLYFFIIFGWLCLWEKTSVQLDMTKFCLDRFIWVTRLWPCRGCWLGRAGLGGRGLLQHLRTQKLDPFVFGDVLVVLQLSNVRTMLQRWKWTWLVQGLKCLWRNSVLHEKAAPLRAKYFVRRRRMKRSFLLPNAFCDSAKFVHFS